jgi:hypothetical protein
MDNNEGSAATTMPRRRGAEGTPPTLSTDAHPFATPFAFATRRDRLPPGEESHAALAFGVPVAPAVRVQVRREGDD